MIPIYIEEYRLLFFKLENKEKAVEILKSFLHFDLDYFTNMYLYTFRYYLARAYAYLGESQKADTLIQEGIASDLTDINKKDMGFFNTTPFFISYLDSPNSERKKYFAYRLYLYYTYTKNIKQAEKFAKIYQQDSYSMFITDFCQK